MGFKGFQKSRELQADLANYCQAQHQRALQGPKVQLSKETQAYVWYSAHLVTWNLPH